MAVLEKRCKECDGPLAQISLNKVWFCYKCSREDVDSAWRCPSGHVVAIENDANDQQVFKCQKCSFKRGPVKRIKNIKKAASKSGTH